MVKKAETYASMASHQVLSSSALQSSATLSTLAFSAIKLHPSEPMISFRRSLEQQA